MKACRGRNAVGWLDARDLEAWLFLVAMMSMVSLAESASSTSQTVTSTAEFVSRDDRRSRGSDDEGLLDE